PPPCPLLQDPPPARQYVILHPVLQYQTLHTSRFESEPLIDLSCYVVLPSVFRVAGWSGLVIMST
ncbi:hypothetical protein PCASD_14424, partial [Puccinia coronata f. sp. avenae]